MSNNWLDSLSENDKEELYINFWKYKDMPRDEIRKAIIGGLHFLTTTDLVGLHGEISSKYYETCEIEEGETGQFEIFKSGESILSKKEHGGFFTIEDVKKKLDVMGQSFYGE